MVFAFGGEFQDRSTVQVKIDDDETMRVDPAGEFVVVILLASCLHFTFCSRNRLPSRLPHLEFSNTF